MTAYKHWEMKREHSNSIPLYGEYVDKIFEKYEAIFVISDIHNNDTCLLAFLKQHNLISDSETCLDNVRCFARNVLIVFLGDVIGKIPKLNLTAYGPSLKVLNFIIQNRENCILVIGNHEVSFLMRNECIDGISNRDITLECLSNNEVYPNVEWPEKVKIYKSLENLKKLKNDNFKFMSEQFEEKLKETEKSDISIRMLCITYILQFSKFLLYFRKLKIYFVHAGFDFDRKMNKQLLSKTCNIRCIQNYNKANPVINKWFQKDCLSRDTTYLFGHDQYLCFDAYNNDYTPFIYTDDTKRNDFVCIDTGCSISNIITCVYFDPHVNPYNTSKQISVRKTDLSIPGCYQYVISIFSEKKNQSVSKTPFRRINDIYP